MAKDLNDPRRRRRKAVAMWRVSSREQKEGYSPDAQKREGLRYADRQALDVVEQFDAAESARDDGRKEFAKFMEYAKSHPEVEVLLVEKPDRLSRNFPEYLKAADLVLEHDKELHFFKLGRVLSKDSPASDWFASDIDISVAKFASMNISQEVRKGFKEKAEQGIYPSSAPFGYVNNKTTKNIEPDPLRAPLFKRMAELYATGRYSIEYIADLAHEKGLRSRKGFKITVNSWWLYFRNVIYAGRFYWNGDLRDGTHKPLISWETHQDILKALRREGKSRGRWQWGKNEAIAFRGLGVCTWPKCPDKGRLLTGDGPKKNNPNYVYYRCSIHAKPAIRQDRLAELLGEGLRNLEIPPDILEWIRGELRSSHEKEREVRETTVRNLENEYDRLQRYIDQGYQDMVDGRIDKEFWQRRNDEWRRRQIEIEGQRVRHREDNEEYIEDGCRLLELAQKAHSLYLRANYEEKRELLEIVLSNFTYDGETVLPTWNKPFDAFVKGDWLGR